MSDSTTIQARIYFKAPLMADHNEVYAALRGDWLPSLDVPVVYRRDSTHADAEHWIDIQYGQAQSPFLGALWHVYAEYLDAVWVRWLAPHEHHDSIASSHAPNAPLIPRACRYAFDTLTVTWGTDDATPAGDFGLTWARDGIMWHADGLQEAYLAGNPRTRLSWVMSPTLPSATSWVCAEPIGDLLFGRWLTQEPITEWLGMPPRLQTAGRIFGKHANQLDFYHAQRLVRRTVRLVSAQASLWWEFNLDDWDNCADTEWQQYHREYCAGMGILGL